MRVDKGSIKVDNRIVLYDYQPPQSILSPYYLNEKILPLSKIKHTMSSSSQYNRRDFLKSSALIGGGLFLGFDLFGSGKFKATVAHAALEGTFDFNAYLAINSDGTATIFSPNPEVGQGIKTSFPMTVAEELDFDWTLVKVVQAPLDTVKFERQVAGGSQSTPHSWKRLRQAGATARRMLMEAAAQRWGVEVGTCTTEKGVVQTPQRQTGDLWRTGRRCRQTHAPERCAAQRPQGF